MSRCIARIVLSLVLSAWAAALPAFVADEFNSAALAPHWKWLDSRPAGGAWSLTGSALKLQARAGATHSFIADNYACLEQSAPAGTNWEVVTKIDRLDMPAPTKPSPVSRSGLMLWQDNDHWIGVAVVTDDSATSRGVMGLYECDPRSKGKDRKFHDNDMVYWGITSPALYLKISKSTDGYAGYVSADGTQWLPVTPLIRNPENAVDGTFRNEKVRLFQSTSGPARSTGEGAPAGFDYVRVGATPPPRAGFEPDEFDDPQAARVRWRHFVGYHPGAWRVDQGELILGGAPHQDFWENVDRISFLYQDAPQSPNNWSVIAKCAPTNLRPYPRYTGYGLMLWQDQNDWAMISNLVHPDRGNCIEVGYQVNGGARFHRHRAHLGYRELPSYLRIKKLGQTYRCAFSFDNAEWAELPPGGVEYPTPLRSPQLRLFVKGPYTTSPGSFEARFDWIRQAGVMEGLKMMTETFPEK